MFMRPMMMGAAYAALNPADVFQSRLRTGTGAARTETVGFSPDLVWPKRRDSTGSHYLFDQDRGALQEINTDTTDASASLANSLTAFNANGYSLGSASAINGSGATFVDWLFKVAPGFFARGAFTKTSGTAVTLDLSALGAVGFVVVKAVSATSDWYVWHRNASAGNNLRFNTSAAQSTTNAYISVSGTTVTFAAAAPAATYEFYALAHRPDGIVQCGVVATVIGTVNVDLGWDVQWLLTKAANDVGNWAIRDTARGFDQSSANTILVNTNGAEVSGSTTYKKTANGFSATQTSASGDVFYIAIKAT